jgi:hypothetical protein
MLTRVLAILGLLACASGCTRLLTPLGGDAPLGAASLSAGEWSGTTTQGTPIVFTVGANETITTITLGYDFNGCSGSHTFSDLLVPTRPDVTCIPGPCTGALTTYRAFGYSNGSPATGPYTQINGLFLPGGEARGQAVFSAYPNCGTTPPVEWTATKR